MRILFLHPDLGIGGAERLVVDAALALQQHGHDVAILTNHHDPLHCFSETVDGTVAVRAVGDWLPRSIFGRFSAFCAYLRMLYAAFFAAFLMRSEVDVIIADQIPIAIPVLRLALARRRPKIIFYCHFPDQLLSKPGGRWKRYYRAPLNYLEEVTIGMADTVLVNSKFTLRVFRETFRRLDVVPSVLYPSLNTKYYDRMAEEPATSMQHLVPATMLRDAFVYLDINRYERKKNHSLALRSFKLLADSLPAGDYKRCRLIIAGGYDTANVENVQHYEELQQLAAELGLAENTGLLRSPSDREKYALLDASHCLVYTPENEHFGIVPLEGMYMAKPVIAMNSGGPTETIVHNATGLLCESQEDQLAAAMAQIYRNDSLRERMGLMGRKRVQQKFSFEAFASKLDSIVREVLQQDGEDQPGGGKKAN